MASFLIAFVYGGWIERTGVFGAGVAHEFLEFFVHGLDFCYDTWCSILEKGWEDASAYRYCVCTKGESFESIVASLDRTVYED